MQVDRKVVITCAVTGAAHTPTMSKYLPITPEEIARAAIEAAEAGAAIVHFHAREPQSGRPTADPEVYGAFLEKVRSASDVVVNVTTSGGPSTSLEERIAAAVRFRPELASLNMGSLSPYGRQRIADKYSAWLHPWEEEHLRGAPRRTYINNEEMIEKIITTVGRAGTRFECECYDVGHLYNVAYFAEKGLLEPPFLLQLVFGFSGGIGLDPINITHMRTVADHLFGTQYHWSILAPGKHQLRLCTMAAAMGGNVRVGLEDNLYLAKGQLAKSNAEQVARIRQILELLSLEIATADDVRNTYGLRCPTFAGG